MTDREIIKALECCLKHYGCMDCPVRGKDGCMSILYKNSLDIITRQQAEIEKLKDCERILICQLAEERENTVKEFANRLKNDFMNYKCDATIGYVENIVKEMIGD